MALQVWLPFTKDTNNYGLSQIGSPTVNGLTANTSGKLGGCYKGYSLYHLSEDIIDNEWTIAAWVKSDSWSQYNDIIFCKNVSASNDCQIYFSIVSGNILNIEINGPAGSMTYDYTFSTNTWYHIAATYNGSKCVMYINGTKVKEGTDTTAKPTGRLNICVGGRSTNTGGTSATGSQSYINDLRLYDHALSPREVAEIAKGLVLHYPLAMPGQENLTPCGGIYTQSNPRTTTFSKTDGNSWIPNSAFEGTPSTTYTISVQCDGTLSNTHGSGGLSPTDKPWSFWLYISNTDTSKSWQTGSYDTPINLNSSNHNYRKIGNTHVWTYTLSSTQKYISLRTNSYSDGTTNVTVNWWNIKVEKGDTFTPWIPNTSSELYTALGFNDGIEYDTSGYGHNADIINSPTYTADTPRYQTAIHMTATNQKLHVSNLVTSGFGNTYSIAWWGKSNTYSGTMHWGFSDGIRLNGIYNGNLWNTGDGSNNPLYKPGTTTQVTAPTVNVWHHFVMVGDGSTCKAYMDGELWGQAKTYKAISGTSIYFNGWDSSTSYCQSDLNVSDFRIYATALTADQVKQLYEAPISLANNGTLFANEFCEC